MHAYVPTPTLRVCVCVCVRELPLTDEELLQQLAVCFGDIPLRLMEARKEKPSAACTRRRNSLG